jgi:uncharacterized protein
MIYRKQYMNRLIAFKDNKIIKIITGLRRTGKSTLLEMFGNYLISQGIDSNAVLHINFELYEYNRIRTDEDLYNLIKSKIDTKVKNYILLDEVQEIEHWEKAINGLSVELDVDIYLTGSNAHMLSSELSTYLSGRYVEIKMLPLSFKEYYDFYKDSGMSKDDMFSQFMKYGGMPQLTTLPIDSAIINSFLEGLYNTVILKDVVARNKIKDIDLLKHIFRFLCSNIGSIVSANSISKYISKASKLDKDIRPATISNYLSMLENAYIVYKSDRYDIKGKELLKSLEKYYIADIGIRNSLLGYTDTDYGHMLENIVFFELLGRGYQVHIGKYDSLEIDFVAVNHEERLYYQVAETILGESTRERELRSLQIVKDHYEKTILTMDKIFPTNKDGIKIKNIIEFLLED